LYSKGYVEGSVEMGEIDPRNVKLYYAMFNLLLISMTFAFFSNNLAMFWIFAELTTAFSAVLVVTLNAKKNIGAALKYIFIASTCMLFSFIGLIFIFATTKQTMGTGTLNWNLLMTYAQYLPTDILFAAFAFTFIGFAAKSGIVPFHGWLPTAHSKAPAPISVILSGGVTSIGIYGIIRMYAIANQTMMVSKASMLLIAFGIISIAIAAFSMLAIQNLKKLIGYSTVENMGIVLVGLGIGTPVAIFWTLFHVMAHALTKGLLFLSAGVIHHQYHGVRLDHIKDALKRQPIASWGLILGGAAIIGMPPFAIFISKLFILLQAGNMSSGLLVILLVLFLVAASSYAVFLSKMFSQTEDDATGHEHDNDNNGINNNVTNAKKIRQYDVPFEMTASIVVFILMIPVLGVFMPQFVGEMLQNIVQELGI